METNVSEKHTSFIFRAKDGSSIFYKNVGPTYKPRGEMHNMKPTEYGKRKVMKGLSTSNFVKCVNQI
jgi:hypothetical protein